MDTKQRTLLKSKAQVIEPAVFVGKEGITEPVIVTLKEALRARELVKISVQESVGETLDDIALKLSRKTQSEIVQTIGRKIVLYKKTDKRGFVHLV